MKIIQADPTGFCFGVKRAIDKLEEALKKYGTVYAMGSPIHNPQEISRLEGLGLVVVESFSDIPNDSLVFLRAHGVNPATYEYLTGNNCTIIDGTCPFVANAQEKARSLSEEGYAVVIIGDHDHPEIRAIRGFVDGECHVIPSETDVFMFYGKEKIGVVSQTTQDENVFAETVGTLVRCVKEVKVYNTICKATVERQNAIRKLAKDVDAIIVIGGRNSANTSRLVDIAVSRGVRTLWVEHAEEIDPAWLESVETIGIAAGASTPDWLINEVQILLGNLQVVKGDGKL